MKTIACLVTMFVISFSGLSQGSDWLLEDERARSQSSIAAPGKNAAYLYKQVNRWLVATFQNPQDVIKACIESEYIRGQVYHSNFFKIGALSGTDLQYTFSIDVKDEKVRLTLYNAQVLYDDYQDISKAHPLEAYLKSINKKKKDPHAENIISSINALSASLFKSLENFLLTEYVSNHDW